MWRVNDRREHVREGMSVRWPRVGGLVLDFIILWWGSQGLDGRRRDVFIRKIDPKVFEVKLLRFNPPNFQWLQAFGQLGVLPVKWVPPAGLPICSGGGGGGACLI